MSQSITKSVLETPKSCRHFRKGFLFIVCAVFVPLQFLPGTFLIPKSASIVYVPLTCSFRDYDHDPDRLYGITSKDYPPPFLRTSFYIYGKPPVLLPIATRSDKVCSRGEALVMDGTNPSMLSLSKLRNQLPSNTSAFWNRFPDASYLVSSTFKGNHQCKYIPRKKRKKTTLESTVGRKTRGADLLIVNSQIQTLWQSHIWNSETVGSDEALQYSADDVRIFLHDGNLWMSYKRYPVIREGIPRSVQRINRLWFGHHGVEVVAMADPAFEINLCCGRNFGMLPPSVEGKLSFLTWPDPVCVHSLDTRSVLSSGNYLVDFEEPIHIKSRMPNKKPSEFHGTSNQLLFIADWNEYLGIGHFHRERK